MVVVIVMVVIMVRVMVRICIMVRVRSMDRTTPKLSWSWQPRSRLGLVR